MEETVECGGASENYCYNTMLRSEIPLTCSVSLFLVSKTLHVLYFHLPYFPLTLLCNQYVLWGGVS